jgi:hypothetical protein
MGAGGKILHVLVNENARHLVIVIKKLPLFLENVARRSLEIGMILPNYDVARLGACNYRADIVLNACSSRILIALRDYFIGIVDSRRNDCARGLMSFDPRSECCTAWTSLGL